jgi:hypothetical protein
VDFVSTFHQAVMPLAAVDPAAPFETLRWDRRLRDAAVGLRVLARLVIDLERRHRPHASIDPFGRMTAAWVTRLIESFQDLNFEWHISLLDRYPETLNLPHYEQALAEAKRKAAPPPAAPAPVVPDLKRELTAKTPNFEAEVTYRVPVPAHGGGTKEYETTLSTGLVKDLAGPNSSQGVRLLKTLYTPQTSQSGIKSLGSSGENIIEIKAIMNGHWRIIGCLDGFKLRLLSLQDMPASKAGYANRLDKNLCR